MNKTKIYTIYQLNKITNTIQFIAEYYDVKSAQDIADVIEDAKTLEDLKKDYNIKGYNYNDYVAKIDESADTYKARRLLQDKYFIVRSCEDLRA